MTNKEFEVFADAYVDNQTCQEENKLLKKEAIELKQKNDSIFKADSLEKVDLKDANDKKEVISNNYKKGRDDCKEENRKLNKWNTFWKNTTVSLTIVAIIETGLIYFTFKK